MSLIDYLVFASYRHNRRSNPDIPAERWAAIFDNAAELEAAYQRECGEEFQLLLEAEYARQIFAADYASEQARILHYELRSGEWE